MSQFKRHPVIMLPHSNISTPFTKYLGSKLLSVNLDILAAHTNQHLYFTSEDEVNVNDYYYDSVLKKVDRCVLYIGIHATCKKIISTTDTDLFKLEDCPVRGATSSVKYILPKPSQDFIRKYVASYNKGKIITEVFVEYEEIPVSEYKVEVQSSYGNKLKIHTETNTITIKKLQENWNREGIAAVLRDYDKDKRVNIEWYIENKL